MEKNIWIKDFDNLPEGIIEIKQNKSAYCEYEVIFSQWNIEPSEVPNLIIDSVRWLPITGTRIDPELAERRNNNKAWDWGAPWIPQYAVSYVPDNATIIKAIGRLK